MVTRGFTGRSPAAATQDRLPPGQHEVSDFPVLSAGPAPRLATDTWSFELKAGPRRLARWTWDEFTTLPQARQTRDIHCVTSWSKLDTRWEGVLVADIFRAARIDPPTPYLLAHSHDGYSTNIPVRDLLDGDAMVAHTYDGRPLERDHGGPARLLVPRLYFWKSAKWLSGLQFTDQDVAGFWELRGYHMYGDPLRQQRYTGD